MRSIFVEGLKTAREIVAKKGIEELDKLIAEHESGSPSLFTKKETTRINIKMKAQTR